METKEVISTKQKIVNAFTLNKERPTLRQLWTFTIFMFLFYTNLMCIFDDVGILPENITWISYGLAFTIIAIQSLMMYMILVCGTSYDELDNEMIKGFGIVFIIAMETLWYALYLDHISRTWPTAIVVPIISAIIITNIWFWGWMFIQKSEKQNDI
jgi:hypothetical protein